VWTGAEFGYAESPRRIVVLEHYAGAICELFIEEDGAFQPGV